MSRTAALRPFILALAVLALVFGTGGRFAEAAPSGHPPGCMAAMAHAEHGKPTHAPAMADCAACCAGLGVLVSPAPAAAPLRETTAALPRPPRLAEPVGRSPAPDLDPPRA